MNRCHFLALATAMQTEGAALYFELCHTMWKGDKVQAGYDVFPFRRATRANARGLFGEPPFEALKALRDTQTLAHEPQHWFIANGWRAPGMKPLPVPRKIELNKPAKFNFDLSTPRGDARIRIQADQSLASTEWTATFNGEALVATPDVTEPFAVPYPSMLAKPEELRSWLIPARLLCEGKNSLEVTLAAGEAVTIVFVDMASSTSESH